MTQAPTPGPLWMMHVIGPDDIYPAPDHATAVEWCAALNASTPASDVLCVAVPAIWTGTPEAHAEGLSEAVEGWTSPRQRLAPTAPVEASGSVLSREQIIDALHDHIDAELAGIREDRVEITGIDNAADAILALLSARPLALGGQQGVQERCQRCGGEVQGWLCQSCPAEFRENDDGHLVFDEDTTPARAEAQDEGAAGYEVEYSAPTMVRVRRARPSPTPAADADRVRIAVEALEPFGLLAPSEVSKGVNMADPLSKWFTVAQFERAASAIEALKSTAAKEGGEV